MTGQHMPAPDTTDKLPGVIVVGTGFGCRIQVPALRAAGFEVLALVGTDQQRTSDRAAAHGIPAAFTDLEVAVEKMGPKAIAISTPPDTHCKLVLKAIELGCHVLCEKPFAMNRNEALEMLHAAEAAGIAHVLGNEFRWEAVRGTAMQLTQEGAIGEPRFATFTQYVHYAGNPGVDLPDWWFNPAAGGGWLGASGSHLIDWIRSWLGDFESVSASLSSVTGPPGGADDSYIIRFRLINGLEGVIQQCAGAWGDNAAIVRVAGSQGTVWLDKGEIWIADAAGSRPMPIPTELQLPVPQMPNDADPRRASPEWQMLTALELAPYTKLAEAWRAAIEGTPASGPARLPTFADGVANMAVLDAIRASAGAGGELVRLTAIGSAG